MILLYGKKPVASEAVWTAVQEDFALASAYGLQGVPALIINQKYLINGAVPKQQISQTIQKFRRRKTTATVSFINSFF